jgi:hypothetical protein
MGFSISDIKNIFDRPKTDNAPPNGKQEDKSGGLLNNMDKLYKVESQNWYSAKPYGFKMTTREGGTFTMFLPISPSNLNINTNFATNIVPTLYGTVEEHSDVRYFDISIEGTTGMAPKFSAPGAGSKVDVLYSDLNKNHGRTTMSVAQTINAGGFFSKSLSVINQIKNKAADLLDGGLKPQSGVNTDNNGYVAFHNLYRFLLQYKKDAAGVSSTTAREQHPLTFFNYKDNNQYDVVVRSFTMRRSADNPMLYYYSIQLRGYNMGSISSPINDNLTQRLKDLGLNGVDSSSVLGDIKSISGQAKSIIGAAIGGISILGR